MNFVREREYHGMMPYERFLAWRVAHQLALELFRETDRWAREERYGISIQLRRASESWATLEALRTRAAQLTWKLYATVSKRAAKQPREG